MWPPEVTEYILICCVKYILLHTERWWRVFARISETEPNNLIYDPLVSSEIRNSSISTEIVGNIQKSPGTSKEDAEVLYALCTLDGTPFLFLFSVFSWCTKFR